MKPIGDKGKRESRSVSLYPHQRAFFTKLGGSHWLQQQIERAIYESANQSGLVSVSDVPMGQADNGRRGKCVRVPKESVRVQREDNGGLQPHRA
jgi:hypothetical protein